MDAKRSRQTLVGINDCMIAHCGEGYSHSSNTLR